MPNPELTEIAVILDRSGSMSRIKDAMEESFDAFVKEQSALPGKCVFSMYQFDDTFETVYQEHDAHTTPQLLLIPRGGTALLDAVGKAMALIGERLAKKAEQDRPGKVIILVITDGQENSSSEFKRQQIAETVKHQQDKYNWQFVFLGANIDSWAESSVLGFRQAATLDYAATTAGVQDGVLALSNAVSSYRKGIIGEVSFDVDRVKSPAKPTA